MHAAHYGPMRKVELSYQLSAERGSAALIRNPLMDLLFAVRTQGSISGAARQLGLSYRHVWGQLKDWEKTLGQELIVWERGQAAQLTPFADKLLWTERLAQARLGPKIEALRAELERTLALAFDPSAHVLSLYASHDDALPRLQDCAATTASLHLDIQFCGSVDAIRALNEGRCVLAGFHAREHPAADSLTARTYRPLLQPGLHKLIGFARRTQGLMVARGNPLRIDSLARAARWKARYVNRLPSAGTRVLYNTGPTINGVNLYQSRANAAGATLVNGSHRKVNLDNDQHVTVHQGGTSVEANWTLPSDFTLTSISSYRYWNFTPANDDGLNVAATYNAGVSVEDKQYSQEFRLASPKGESFDYVLGAYYFGSDLDNKSFAYYGPKADIWNGTRPGP